MFSERGWERFEEGSAAEGAEEGGVREGTQLHQPHRGGAANSWRQDSGEETEGGGRGPAKGTAETAL